MWRFVEAKAEIDAKRSAAEALHQKEAKKKRSEKAARQLLFEEED